MLLSPRPLTPTRFPSLFPHCVARVACHYGDTEQDMSSTLSITSGAVFNKVLLFMLKEADGIFRRMLGLQQDSSTAAAGAAEGPAAAGGSATKPSVLLAEQVTKAQRWRKVSRQDTARHGTALQGRAWPGAAGQGRAGQDGAGLTGTARQVSDGCVLTLTATAGFSGFASSIDCVALHRSVDYSTMYGTTCSITTYCKQKCLWL